MKSNKPLFGKTKSIIKGKRRGIKMRKLPPWLIEIPQQMNLFGVICPICERNALLKAMVFKEGMGFICERCYESRTLADIYQPPKFEEFKKRVKRRKKV